MKQELKASPLLFRWESFLLLILIAVVIANSFLSPYFLDIDNIFDTTFNFTEKALIALPMIFIIILGEIDISVASIIALSSLFMGLFASLGGNTPLLVFTGITVGLLAGMVNGFLVSRFRIPSIAITIGTMSLFRGIAFVILGDQAFTKYPESFQYFGQGYIGDSPVPFELVVFIVFAVIFGLVLHKTTFGRKTFAIGNNPTTSLFSGINVRRTKLIIFSLTGLMCGLSSVLLTSRIGSTRPNIANGWELEIITTVVLGGVSISGGKGNIFGVVIAVFLLGFMRFGMSLLNIPGQFMSIVIGVLLITAILIPEMLRNFRKTRNSSVA